MAWVDVSQKLRFYGYPDTWTLPAGEATSPTFSVPDKDKTQTYLESLYTTSATARGMLDQLSASGLIRISQSAPNNPGYAVATVLPQMGFNYDAISRFHYFNKKGEMVPEKAELTIAHELAHMSNPTFADPAGGQAAMNGASYDFDGPIVGIQNQVAREIGATSNLQVSYAATLISGVDPGFSEFKQNYSYSYKRDVDIVRLGDQNGAVDTMDLSSRTDLKTSLMFGLSGNDVLKGSGGVDFLYGGKGADQLFGNGGNDYLVFDTSDTKVDGGAGFDTAVLTAGVDATTGKPLGATFNPSSLGLRLIERVYGTEGDDLITISGGAYIVDGAAGNDRFTLSGTAAITLEFRSGFGQDFVDGLFIPQSSGKAWIAARQNDTIKFVDLMPADVSLIWTYTESGIGNWAYRTGAFSIKVNATGDTISFGELYAEIFYYIHVPGDMAASEVLVFYDGGAAEEYDSSNVVYKGTHGDASTRDIYYHFDLFQFADGSRYSIVDLFQLSDYASSAQPTSASIAPQRDEWYQTASSPEASFQQAGAARWINDHLYNLHHDLMLL
ncbi:MAG TPA: hypothetical protein VF631_07730 [Allosphingosinicella sp.]|jgi:hypothetical protein|uniref:calcium-binding protein n=1 Tax=Allosphingosinicella sp. TaxID=2823234 RepID=UPI002F2972F4